MYVYYKRPYIMYISLWTSLQTTVLALPMNFDFLTYMSLHVCSLHIVCVCMCVCVCVCVYVCVCMCVCIVRDLALCIFHRGRHSEVPSCSCQYNTALLHICHFKYASYTLHRGRHSKVLSCRCLYNTVLLYICHFTLSFHIALEPLIIGLFSGK